MIRNALGLDGRGKGEEKQRRSTESNSEMVGWSLHKDTNLFQLLIVKDHPYRSEVGGKSIQFKRMDTETLKLIKS